MSAWDEFVAFVRGTRPRPPPGPRKPAAAALLVAACVMHLPLVYLLLQHDAPTPPLVLTVGLLCMGLAWSGGVALEGRRHGTTRAFAIAGVAEGALAFLPQAADALGAARWLFLAIAALAAGALFALHRPAQHGSE